MPLKSYTGKIYSLLVSEFRHVLMIDADCMPVQVRGVVGPGTVTGQTGGGGRGALRGRRGGALAVMVRGGLIITHATPVFP